jgi:hypothetical protein
LIIVVVSVKFLRKREPMGYVEIYKPGMVVHVYNPSFWEAEAG